MSWRGRRVHGRGVNAHRPLGEVGAVRVGQPMPRLRRRRSRSESPPQMPKRSSCASAYSRHSSRTSQPRQIRFASRVEPPFSGKNASGSVCAHRARSCHCSSMDSNISSNPVTIRLSRGVELSSPAPSRSIRPMSAQTPRAAPAVESVGVTISSAIAPPPHCVLAQNDSFRRTNTDTDGPTPRRCPADIPELVFRCEHAFENVFTPGTLARTRNDMSVIRHAGWDDGQATDTIPLLSAVDFSVDLVLGIANEQQI